jgi:hypothetical protein
MHLIPDVYFNKPGMLSNAFSTTTTSVALALLFSVHEILSNDEASKKNKAKYVRIVV